MPIERANDAAVRVLARTGFYLFTGQALTPDGASLLVSQRGGVVIRYGLATGAETGRWQVGSTLSGMSLSPDGRYLWAGDLDLVSATVGADGGVTAVAALHRLDLASGVVTDFTRTTTAPGNDDVFYDVAALDDGDVIVSLSTPTANEASRTLLRFDPASGTFAPVDGSQASEPAVLAVSADGMHVIAGANGADAQAFEYTVRQGVTARLDDVAADGGAKAVNRDGSGYVQAAGSQLAFYDGDLREQMTVELGNLTPLDYRSLFLEGVVYDPAGVYGFALDSNKGVIYRIVLATGKVDAVVSVPASTVTSADDGSAIIRRPAPNYGDRLAISADGATLSVQGSRAISVISTAAIVPTPLLTAFSIDQRPIVTLAGGSLGYTFSAQSATSTVASVTFTFAGPLATVDGPVSSVTVTNPDRTAQFEATGSIPLSDEAGGSGQITSVTVSDADGYAATYGDLNIVSAVNFYVAVDIALTSGNDTYSHAGRPGDISIFGADGDDVIAGGLGYDTLDGGAGIDTVDYSLPYRSYVVNVTTAKDDPQVGGTIRGGDAAVDRVTGIERYVFEDGILDFERSGFASRVESLFRAAFSRGSDAASFNRLMQAHDAGATLRDLAKIVVTFPAFQDYQGHLSDADYVETLYRTILYRPSDVDGKASWVEGLRSGRFDRADVLVGLSDSAENLGARLGAAAGGLFHVYADAQNVAQLYDAAFAHQPDAAGFADWLSSLRGGTATLGQVADGFVNSAEFLEHTTGFSNGAFVDYLYQTALDRGSDPDGKASWVAALDGGAGKGQVLLGFALSAEHVAMNAANVDYGIVLG